MLRIRLYAPADEPRPYLTSAAAEAERRGQYSRKCKFHRDPWSLAEHWRETFPVRDYLSRLAKLSPRTLGDVELELYDGTRLSGAEAVAYITRYRS